jgi:hypothetical protein
MLMSGKGNEPMSMMLPSCSWERAPKKVLGEHRRNFSPKLQQIRLEEAKVKGARAAQPNQHNFEEMQFCQCSIILKISGHQPRPLRQFTLNCAGVQLNAI